MALTNKDRISRTIDCLREGLTPFVERQLKAHYRNNWSATVDSSLREPLRREREGKIAWDTQALFTVMDKFWRPAFEDQLGRAERAYIHELREAMRNAFAHERAFSYEDTERALDTAERLLRAISAAKYAETVSRLRVDLKRVIYDEDRRKQVRRQQTLTLDGKPKEGLKAWRDLITPHQDVATGRYSEAEFAADLAQVLRGGAGPEYGDPEEFFRRTFLTDGLSKLVKGALLRLGGKGGDPVVELQTNFGGGKTHSMLALYHLAGYADPASLAGVDQLMSEQGIAHLPKVNCAVLVGTALSPADPSDHKEDGISTRTLWGELAWQLGGAEGYEQVAESDAASVSPGSDRLQQLLQRFSPCLILIDEWVAFVRQLYGNSELPAGSFDANLTFAQALTEAVKATPGALLVASLPASDIEIGGEGGEKALDRLKNTFGRLESSWRPATPEEGFEIVRRRLFEPMVDKNDFAARDAVVKAFADMYRESGKHFPSDCAEGEYRRLMEAAYPIHPELFQRLNKEWGSLQRFQRTRGVLRLMAAVIHNLWEQGDKSLMIMPASIPIHDREVGSELTRYLQQRWDAIINADIDGANATPFAIDKENPTLGRYGAARRVARAIFMASVPNYDGPNPGVDDRRITLGCTQPGETPGTFGDALRRLADRATYLYVDGSRYWFSTQPSVTRTADDRAKALDEADVQAALVEHLQKERDRGPFAGVHIAPDSSGDVPDDTGARLVILGPDYPYSNGKGGKAKEAAEAMLASRGQQPRVYRNSLLFLAPDERRLGELLAAMRSLMAWQSIVDDQEALNLDEFQRKQAKSQSKSFETTVASRILETWVWAMAPHQPDPGSRVIEWSCQRLSGQGGLAARAAKRFEADEALLTQLGARRLRAALDEFDLWRGNPHIEVNQAATDFASYLYLPRLKTPKLIEEAIRASLGQLVHDQIAYAEAIDDDQARYDGLASPGNTHAVIEPAGLIVKAEVAAEQTPAEPSPESDEAASETNGAIPHGQPCMSAPIRRFYGSVKIDPLRAGRDAGRIADEIVQHLATLRGAEVTVKVEIDVELPDGISEDLQRVVDENCNVLKFENHGFEKV